MTAELCRFTVLVKVFEPGTFKLLYRLEPAECDREFPHRGHHVVPNVATKEGKRR